MKIIHKFSLACLLTLVSASIAPAQSVESVADPCGDPEVESFSCPLIRGRVVEVPGGDRVVLLMADGRRLRVRLNGIAAPGRRQAYGRASRLLLNSLVSGRVVDVCGSTSQYLRLLRGAKVEEVTGVVSIRSMGHLDVNLTMIQAGLARHAKAGEYSMSNHAECHYVRAEEEARAAGRGLWPAPPNKGLHPAANQRSSHR